MKELGKITIIHGRSSKDIFTRFVFFGAILSVLIISVICLIDAFKFVNKPFPGFLLNERMAISTIGQYNWTGTQAGLKYPDKILKANGKAISSPRDFEEVIENANIGDPITYSVEKGKKIFEVTVRTMHFSWFDLFMTFGITFIAGICYLIIGSVVFILKPNTKVSWTFMFACFFLSLWSIIIFDMQTIYSRFIRIYLFANALFPAVFVHFSLYFPQPGRVVIKHPAIQIAPYLTSLMLLLPIELLYPDESFLIFWRLLLVYVILGAFMVLYPIMSSFFKPVSVLARQRAKVVLFGTAVAFPLPAIAFFSQATFGSFLGMRLETNFLILFLTIFPATIAYAIAKHNLFDVDLYIKRAMGYSIMIALVLISEVSLDLLSKKVLSQILGEYAEKAFPILFALLIVLLFNPVYHKVRECVDKCFFRKKFDYKKTVLAVSDALTSVLNLDEIIKKIINTVRKEMFIDTAGVVLVDPQQKCCRTVFVGDKPGNTEDRIKDVCIPCDDPLLTLVAKEKKLITKYDIEEDPYYIDLKESCGQRFEEMGASMVMPLVYQNEVKGAIALGYKKSGHFYTREDIDLLETLTNHGAIAIENARLAEQMKEEITVRTDLARYISPQVVEQIIKKDRQVNFGVDKKVVTVLISDIRNFTKITENYPPDQLVQILNEYFTEMAKIIFENQGSLDKYIGDAIVAVFGSLIPLENSAEFAVRAAAQMMKRMIALNERWAGQYGLVMNIGIGINTGEVFLGNVGSPERMEFTVIGDTVNVTSRLSDLARAGQILITKDTLACMGTDIKYRELPPAEVKGKSGKLKLFEILYS